MVYSPRDHKESDRTERLHFHFQAKIKDSFQLLCEAGDEVVL